MVRPKRSKNSNSKKVNPLKGRKSATSTQAEEDVLSDSIVTLFTSETYTDIEDEGPGTPDSEKDDLDYILDATNHLFITKMNMDYIPEPSDTNIETGCVKPYAEYYIENSQGEVTLMAKQVEVGYYDEGRLPISYDVCNRHGHLIFTTDGRETKCGMYVLIKGHGEVVRGKVASNGLLGYLIQDFLTGRDYCVTLPCWVVFFTCTLFCFHPQLKIFRKLDTNGTSSLKLVASIGTKRWPETVFSDAWKFGLKFDKQTNPDTKLFLFSTALVMFHVYFKKNGREMRCLFSYLFILLLLGLIIFIGIYTVKTMAREDQSNKNV